MFDIFRGYMSLWGRNADRVSVNNVYGISRVKIENWPREGTHRHIQLLRESNVIPRGELAEIFAGVTYSDAIVTGTLIGFEDIYVYRSCLACKRRQSGDRCTPCDSALLLNDFKVSMMIVCNI